MSKDNCKAFFKVVADDSEKANEILEQLKALLKARGL